MPGRQSHGSAPSKKPKVRARSKKRTLDAFSIASHQTSDNVKIRQHRLGVSEGGGNRPNKRRRNEDEEGDDQSEQNNKKQRIAAQKGRFDELNLDEGSDSEGNEWKLGQIDSDDDSDLDSEEAFGESDEERFEGFAFSGSSEKKGQKKLSTQHKSVNLDEDSADGTSDSELEEGDLGEDAIDLAAMLDATEEEDGDMAIRNREQDIAGSDTEEEEEEDSESSNDDESVSSMDDEEASDPAKLVALQRLIEGLPQTDSSIRGRPNDRSDGASEHNRPSDFGLIPKTMLTLEDLGIPAIQDPKIKKSLKLLDPSSEGKRKGAPRRLDVPLARRQQDRLDRSAAYDKTKETLERWTDTVKHNRRADHLIFPLTNNDLISAQANSRLQPTTTLKPFNELEATIQSILEESGLAAANGRDGEDRIREFEELETNKMSMEEVKERRTQLRMARELLFREEAKSKRIKKIKSKSYRRVHRKQREKEERIHKEALAQGGFVPSEDELDAQDRRRATERMGQKHRGSKWAKATKETGRAAWDEDARAGMSEMARRDEELRKRVEGRAVRKEFENDSDVSYEDSDDEISEDDDLAERKRLLRQLDRVNNRNSVGDEVAGSKLHNMKFMLKAEESIRKQNSHMVEDIRRELAGEDSTSEDGDREIGRRSFGPGINKVLDAVGRPTGREFVEPMDTEDGDGRDGLDAREVDNNPEMPRGPRTGKATYSKAKSLEQPTLEMQQPEMSGGAWSKVVTKSSSINNAEAKRRRHNNNNALDVEELDLSKAAIIATKPKTSKSLRTTSTLQLSSDEDSDNENAVHLPFAIRDQELIRRAFAGQDIVGDFNTEKQQIIADEDEKVVDNTLPGWGSWVGEGLSKKEKARNKGKVLTKVEGVKEQNRKDAKLDRVIINEKRVKKNGKYLASTLPHPFETRQQYERSLRLPVGPEWATKETFQEATKPRILLKQGIIAPMAKPLL